MADGLRPYCEYKDSGLPWLGMIPVHWEIRRNGRLFNQRNQTAFADLPILEVSLRTGVRVRDFEQSQRKQVMADRDKYKRAAKGDIAYNMMRLWQGAVGVAPVDGLVSPAYVVARPYPEVDSRYFAYLFRTDLYMNEVNKYSHGIVVDRNRLYWDEFKQMPSSFPPPDEQRHIANFLDAHGRHVHQFIRAKRRLIELLNEQKQAIINRAVTRGLDPSVPLRPSGVPWLGDIPQHWEATKLYRVTDPARKIMYGIVLPGPDVDTGVYIVKGGNCEDGRLRAECLSRTTTEIESGYARSRLRRSDIVYAIRGSIGAAQLVPDELTGANLTQDAARIGPGPGILPQWLLFAVRSRSFFSKLEAGALGATIRGINIRDLKRADLAVPPMEEQEQIAMFLLERTGRVDTAISRLEREITLLREHRTRLIADVVSGKLNVRGVEGQAEDGEGGEPELMEEEDSEHLLSADSLHEDIIE